MSESVEKSVIIDVSASGLDDTVAGMERMGSSMRMMGSDFSRAGSSLNFLNRTYFETTRTVTEIDAAGKAHTKTIKEENAALADLAIAFRTVGAAMRLMRSAEDIIGILGRLADASWVAVAAEQARAVASFVANAVSSMGLAVPLMLAGAAAAGALAAYFMTRGHQFGGYMPEGGWAYTHPGETIFSKSESMTLSPVISLPKMGAGAGSVINNYSINDPMFRSHADLDYLLDKLKRMGKA